MKCFALVLLLLGVATSASAQPTNLHLPFMAGDDWWCAQGWNGTTSHQGEAAWDYNYMGGQDLGYPVVASGSGRVIFAGRTKKSDGTYSSYGNVELLDYGGGYYGRNAHLQSLIVLPGEFVLAGQVIGLCGGVGVTDAQWSPHIHYDTQRTSNPAGKDYTPINVLYRTKDGVDLYGYPEPCNCTSQPGDKHYISRNAGVFDRAESMFPEIVNLLRGQRDGNPSWYYAFDPNTTQNVYVQKYKGGAKQGIVIYDALQGARWAVPIAMGFYDTFVSLGGPRSEIGKPTGPEYAMSSTMNRQETQYGFFTWTSSAGVHGYRYNGYFGPGVYQDPSTLKTRWDPQRSYLFTQAHYRNGAGKMVGNPSGSWPWVHRWNGLDIQDFGGGQYGSAMLVLDPIADTYPQTVERKTAWYWPGRSGESTTNQQQAHLMRGPLRTYWIANVAIIGAPITDQWTASDGSQRQRFLKKVNGSWVQTELKSISRGVSTVKTTTLAAPEIPIAEVPEIEQVRPVLRSPIPNPMQGATTVSFILPDATDVTLRLYDLQGRLVQELLRGEMPAGEHAVEWNGTDARGEHISEGIYFIQLITPQTRATQKLVLLR